MSNKRRDIQSFFNTAPVELKSKQSKPQQQQSKQVDPKKAVSTVRAVEQIPQAKQRNSRSPASTKRHSQDQKPSPSPIDRSKKPEGKTKTPSDAPKVARSVSKDPPKKKGAQNHLEVSRIEDVKVQIGSSPTGQLRRSSRSGSKRNSASSMIAETTMKMKMEVEVVLPSNHSKSKEKAGKKAPTTTRVSLSPEPRNMNTRKSTKNSSKQVAETKDVQNIQTSSEQTNKKKLTKLSQKSEVIVKSKAQKVIAVEASEEESDSYDEEDDDDEESIVGQVEYVDENDVKTMIAEGETKNKRGGVRSTKARKVKTTSEQENQPDESGDKYVQKTISFVSSNSNKKVKSADETRESLLSNLAQFLPNSNQMHSLAVAGAGISNESVDSKNDNDNDSLNSDEEELARITRMQELLLTSEVGLRSASAQKEKYVFHNVAPPAIDFGVDMIAEGINDLKREESAASSIQFQVDREEVQEQQHGLSRGESQKNGVQEITQMMDSKSSNSNSFMKAEGEEVDGGFSLNAKVFLINGDTSVLSRNVIENLLRANNAQIRSQISISINYCVLGTKNVSKEKLNWIRQQAKIRVIPEGEFVELVKSHLNLSEDQIREKYSAIFEAGSQQQKPQSRENNNSNNNSIKSDMSSSQNGGAALSRMPSGQSNQSTVHTAAPASDTNVSMNLSHWLPQQNISSTEGQQTGGVFQGKKNSGVRRPAIGMIPEEVVPAFDMKVKSHHSINVRGDGDHNDAVVLNSAKSSEQNAHALWTHKHAPKVLSECVGNRDAISKIENWLRNWENVVLHGQPAKGTWKDNPGAKACLISGPPGIGKTSTVRLLAVKLNMSIIEWNASDVRNKSAIETIVSQLKDNRVLRFDGMQSSGQRSIILMDEVDGMSSGDIGGNASLIKIIKETKNPIFCVCNDRYNQKLRSLATHCFDVRFHKPEKREVATRLAQVCRAENITADTSTLEMLADNANADLRQSLNLLEMCAKKSKVISFRSLSSDITSAKKDDQVTMNVFEATRVLLTKNQFDRLSMPQRMNLFFLDYNLLPLMIHENYLSAVRVRGNGYRCEVDELESIVASANAVCDCDLLAQSMSRNTGAWGLLQDQAFLSTVYIPEKSCVALNTIPSMTSVLGKMSSQRKTRRLIKELRFAFAAMTACGNRLAVQMDYSLPLIDLILTTLESHSSTNPTIDRVVQIMKHYNLTMEMMKEHLISLQYKSIVESRLQEIPTAVKTALTKAYNKKFKDDAKATKKKGKAISAGTTENARDIGEFDEIEGGEELVEGDNNFIDDDSEEKQKSRSENTVEEERKQGDEEEQKEMVFTKVILTKKANENNNKGIKVPSKVSTKTKKNK